MKFGALAGLAPPTEPNRVVPLYDAYMMGDRDLAREAEALTYILTKNADRVATGQRDRGGSWSASSAGACLRQQQFTFLRFKGLEPDEKAQRIFANGDYLHLRWQVAGLVAGWLKDAEVPLTHEGRVRGTMDGDLEWGEVLELKSINARGFEQVMEFGAKEGHKMQASAYGMCTGYTGVRFVYENKNTQDVKEIFFEITDEWREKVLAQWVELNRLTEERTLAPMLHDCVNERGFAFRYCDFRKVCEAARFPRKKLVLK